MVLITNATWYVSLVWPALSAGLLAFTRGAVMADEHDELVEDDEPDTGAADEEAEDTSADEPEDEDDTEA